MATINEIDTKGVVRKFLERKVISDREDESVDSADEIIAVLETVATSFLLYPQAALSFVLLARNALQQIINADLAVVTYLEKAADDVSNPDSPITDSSDLVEAQVALIEVDRLGKVNQETLAYGRYNTAITRFLDRQLASSLKRRRRGEFERSGTEAKQDLFRVLSAFQPAHSLMSARLALLASSVSNFQSVDLTRLVSTKTVQRVRASLTKLLRGVRSNALSKTAVALELLSGAAALKSISSSRQVYDPTVETEEFPPETDIRVHSQPVAATTSSPHDFVDLSDLATPWLFNLTVNPLSAEPEVVSVELPAVGAGGRAWVVATNVGEFDIPADNRTLYLQLDGLTVAAGDQAYVVAITLPTGVQTLAALLTVINTALGSDGTAMEMAPGTNRLLIYGSASVTKVIVRSDVPGIFNAITSVYEPAAGSAHAVLGFSDDQTSLAIGTFSAGQLADILRENVSGVIVTVENGFATITSGSSSYDSSLSFSGLVAAELGFLAAEAEPAYLVLKDGDEEIDPASLGIFPGSVLSALDTRKPPDRNIREPIASIDGSHLLFADDVDLPRVLAESVIIEAPAVAAVQSMLDQIRPLVGTFDNDTRELQRVLSPLISRPTLAQVNDAKRALSGVSSRLTALRDILTSITVRDDQTEFGEISRNIISSLEERGIDRGIDLLTQGDFAGFFSLSNEVASKSSRLMKAIEEVGRKDFTTTTVEEDIPDLEPLGTNPDDDVLDKQELSDEDEDVV